MGLTTMRDWATSAAKTLADDFVLFLIEDNKHEGKEPFAASHLALYADGYDSLTQEHRDDFDKAAEAFFDEMTADRRWRRCDPYERGMFLLGVREELEQCLIEDLKARCRKEDLGVAASG